MRERDHDQAREFMQDIDKSHTDLVMELFEAKKKVRKLERAMDKIHEILMQSTFNRNLRVINIIVEGVRGEREGKKNDSDIVSQDIVETI